MNTYSIIEDPTDEATGETTRAGVEERAGRPVDDRADSAPRQPAPPSRPKATKPTRPAKELINNSASDIEVIGESWI